MHKLLPRTTGEFSKKDYWENFFRTRKTAFEWYGDFLQHSQFFYKYIKKTDRVLIIGCGNSDLGLMIYDKLNVKSVDNIDISKTLIHQMRQKHCCGGARKGLTYECTDVFSLQQKIDSKELDSFSCVIDKGTLDAIHSQENSERDAFSLFSNVQSALNLMGRYVIITLAQEHIIESICKYFIQGTKEWIINCHQLTSNQERRDEPQGDVFPLPVFGFVLTKLQPSDGLPRVSLFSLGSTDPIPLDGNPSEMSQKLASWIAQEQNWSLLRRDLNCGKRTEFRFACPLTGLTVFYGLLTNLKQPDHRPGKSKKSVERVLSRKIDAVFLVPFGQNNNPMYTEEKRRLNLCRTLHVNSLLVVFASTRYFHEDLETLKTKLSSVLSGLTLGDTDMQGAPILSTPDSFVRTTMNIPCSANNCCEIQLDAVKFHVPEQDEPFTLRRLVLPTADLRPILATNASVLSVPSLLAPRDSHLAIWLQIMAPQTGCSRLACYGLPPLGPFTPQQPRHFHITLSDTECGYRSTLQSAFTKLYEDHEAAMTCSRCSEPVRSWSDPLTDVQDDREFNVVVYDPIAGNRSQYYSHFSSDSRNRLTDVCAKKLSADGWFIVMYEELSDGNTPRLKMSSETLNLVVSYVVTDPMFADPKTRIDIFHHSSVDLNTVRMELRIRVKALIDRMNVGDNMSSSTTHCEPLDVCRQIESLLVE